MIEPLKIKFRKLVLNGIASDRSGELMTAIQSSTIQGVICSFVSVEDYKKENNLEFYEGIFEKPFLEASGAYYRLVLSFTQQIIFSMQSENLFFK